MSYAFIIVAGVAITFKLLFMSFSLYFTIKSGRRDAQIQITNGAKQNKSMTISWERVKRKILPKSLYPDDGDKNYSARM